MSIERRRSVRVVPGARDPYCRMRVRTGAELVVLNIGPCGALVESSARLLPGSSHDMHVSTAVGRVVVRTHVVRSCVCALTAGAVRYQSGLAFEHAIDLIPQQAPAA